MSFLSSAGKLLLSGGKSLVKQLSTKEAQTALSLTPLGAVTKAPKLLSAGGKVVSALGKTAKFLFVGETPIKTVRKTVATIVLGGVVAGGGLKLIPETFKGVKKATEKTLDYAFPPEPKYKEVKPKGYLEGQISKEKAPISDIFKTGGAILGVTALGTLIGYGAEKYLSKEEPPLPTDTTLPSPQVSTPFQQPVPLTPQTQVIGREAGLPSRRRKRKAKVSPMPRLTVRNQNINIIGGYSN